MNWRRWVESRWAESSSSLWVGLLCLLGMFPATAQAQQAGGETRIEAGTVYKALGIPGYQSCGEMLTWLLDRGYVSMYEENLLCVDEDDGQFCAHVDGTWYCSGAMPVRSDCDDTPDPDKGDLCYDTTATRAEVYDGTEWDPLGAGGAEPGGSDTQVQFNSSDAFAGDSGMTYNSGTDTLSLLGGLTFPTETAITMTSQGTMTLVANSDTDSGAGGADAASLALRAYSADGDGPRVSLQAGTAAETLTLKAATDSPEQVFTTSEIRLESTRLTDILSCAGVLKTDAQGDIYCGVGSSEPGGAWTTVQYNDGGDLGGDTGMTFDETNDILAVDGGLDLDDDGTADLDADGTGVVLPYSPNYSGPGGDDDLVGLDIGDLGEITFGIGRSDHADGTMMFLRSLESDDGDTGGRTGIVLFGNADDHGNRRHVMWQTNQHDSDEEMGFYFRGSADLDSDGTLEASEGLHGPYGGNSNVDFMAYFPTYGDTDYASGENFIVYFHAADGSGESNNFKLDPDDGVIGFSGTGGVGAQFDTAQVPEKDENETVAGEWDFTDTVTVSGSDYEAYPFNNTGQAFYAQGNILLEGGVYVTFGDDAFAYVKNSALEAFQDSAKMLPKGVYEGGPFGDEDLDGTLDVGAAPVAIDYHSSALSWLGGVEFQGRAVIDPAPYEGDGNGEIYGVWRAGRFADIDDDGTLDAGERMSFWQNLGSWWSGVLDYVGGYWQDIDTDADDTADSVAALWADGSVPSWKFDVDGDASADVQLIDGGVDGDLDGTVDNGGGGAGNPAGSDGDVQYNASGVFGGESDFSYDDSTDTLSVGSLDTTTAADGDRQIVFTDNTSAPDAPDSGETALYSISGDMYKRASGGSSYQIFSAEDGALDDDDVTAADVGSASANLDDTDASIEWEDATDLNASGEVIGGDVDTIDTDADGTAEVSVSGSEILLDPNDDGTAEACVMSDGAYDKDCDGTTDLGGSGSSGGLVHEMVLDPDGSADHILMRTTEPTTVSGVYAALQGSTSLTWDLVYARDADEDSTLGEIIGTDEVTSSTSGASVSTTSPTVPKGAYVRLKASAVSGTPDALFIQFATATATETECNDGVDNDSDGTIDYPADSDACDSATDDDESSGGGSYDTTDILWASAAGSASDWSSPEVGVSNATGPTNITYTTGSGGKCGEGTIFDSGSDVLTLPLIGTTHCTTGWISGSTADCSGGSEGDQIDDITVQFYYNCDVDGDSTCDFNLETAETMFGRDDGSYTPNFLKYDNSADFNVYRFYTGASQETVSSTDIGDSEWHKIKVSWDITGDNRKICVDGTCTENTSEAVTALAATAGEYLVFGQGAGQEADPCYGIYDEIQIGYGYDFDFGTDGGHADGPGCL